MNITEFDAKGHKVIEGLSFDTGKATFKLDSIEALYEIVKLMLANINLKIEIQGHSDSTGNYDANMRLSERRANSLRTFLLLFGIADSRMVVKGYGPDKPIADNNTPAGRVKNRRLELVKIA